MNTFLYASASLAIVLAIYLATGTELPTTSRRLLAAAMLTLAVLNLLTLLQISDPKFAFLAIRPGLAVALPALLYLHIETAIRSDQKLRPADAIHIIGPLVAVLVRLMPNPGQLLDVLIILFNLYYLWLIARYSRQGAASFASFGATVSILLDRWRRVVLLFLVLLVAFDIVVMLEIGDTVGASPQPWMFGAVGLVLALSLTYILVTSLHRKGPLMWASSRHRQHNPEHEAVIESLEDRLLSGKAFLDPNLTLQRFSRRVGLPMREVSAAINDCRHCNYNQWLNNFRIKEAQRLMREKPGQSVTEVMYASGFQNKSTFNAAFLAISGESPTVWKSRLGDVTS